jgi:hypothetical protein
MEPTDLKIAQEHIDEIFEYQAVLSYMLRRKISVKQAIADWIEKGYAERYRRNRK